ncbi:MAG: 50S ribosomal protein L31 [Polyangiales bacterium]
MKSDIHPGYNEVTVKCACGASYATRATKEYTLDVCALCHPFFTGKQKIMDTAGRVERFRKKYANVKGAKA